MNNLTGIFSMKALQSGVNVIETGSNYCGGYSEHVIGDLLNDLFSFGDIKRDVCNLIVIHDEG